MAAILTPVGIWGYNKYFFECIEGSTNCRFGKCENNKCVKCDEGWEGERCDKCKEDKVCLNSGKCASGVCKCADGKFGDINCRSIVEKMGDECDAAKMCDNKFQCIDSKCYQTCKNAEDKSCNGLGDGFRACRQDSAKKLFYCGAQA